MADDMNIQAVLSADASGMVRGFNSATASANQLHAKLAPLNRGLTVAGGVIGGAGFALYKMGRQAFDAAARVSEMRVAIGAIGKASGLGEKAINETANAIRKQGIEMAAAQKIAITYAQNNLNMADAAKVARVAQDLAVISQSNSTATAELLTRAIQTGNSQLLKSAGISRMAGEAYEEYAKKLGKSSTSLSALERQQAITNLILSEGAKVAGIYEAAMTEPGKVLRSFPRLVNDMQVALGQSLLDGFGPAIKAFYDFTKAISQAVSEGGAFYPMAQVMSGVLTQLLEPLTSGINAMTNFAKSLSLNGAGVESATASITKFLPVLSAMAVGLSTLAGKNLLGAIGPLAKYAGMFNPWVAAITVLVALNPRLRDSFMRIVKAFLPLVPAVKNTALAFTKMTEKIVATIADVVDVLVGPLTAAVTVLSAGIYLLTESFGALEPLIYLIGSAMLISMVKGSIMGSEAVKKLVFNLQFMGLQLKETAMRLKTNFAFGLATTGSALKAFAGTGIAAFKAVGLAAKEMAMSMVTTLLPLIAIFAVVKIIQMLGAASKQTKERTNDLSQALKENVSALKGNKDASLEYLASLEGVSTQLATTGEDGSKLTSALGTMGLSAKDFADKLTLLKGAQDKGGTSRIAYYKSLLLAKGVEEKQAQTIAENVHSYENLDDVLWRVDDKYKGYATALEEIDDQAEKTSIQDLVSARLSQISALGKEQAAYATQVEMKVKAKAAEEDLTNETIIAQRVLNELDATYAEFIAQQKAKTEAELKGTQVINKTSVAVASLINRLDALVLAEGEAAFKAEDLAKELFGVAQVEFNKNVRSTLEMRKEMTALHDEVRANVGNFDSLTGSALQLAENIAKNAAEMKTAGKSSADIAAMSTVLSQKFMAVAKAAGFESEVVEELMKGLGLLQNMRTVAVVDLDIDAAVEKLQLLLDGVSEFSNESGNVQGRMKQSLQARIDKLKAEKKSLLAAEKLFTETAGKGDSAANKIKTLRDEIKKTYEDGLGKATDRIKSAQDAQESFAKSVKDTVVDMASLGQAFAEVEENSAKLQESHNTLSSSISDAMLAVSSFTGIIEGQTAAQEALKQSLVGQSNAQTLVNSLQAEQAVLVKRLNSASSRGRAQQVYEQLLKVTDALSTAQYNLAYSNAAVDDAQKESDKVGQSFTEGLRKRVEEARLFGEKIKKLQELGLESGALSQIVGAGAVAGGAMADELIKGAADGLGTIGEVNALVKEATDLATDIGTGVADSYYSIGTNAGQATIDAFKAQAEKATLFADRVKQLIALGLNETNLRQVLDAGVTAGTKMADSLIQGGKDAIDESNRIQTALEDAATSVAQVAAHKYYDAGIAFAQAIYDGLNAKWTALKPKLDKMTGPQLRGALNAAITAVTGVSQAGPDARAPIVGRGGTNRPSTAGSTTPRLGGVPSLSVSSGLPTLDLSGVDWSSLGFGTLMASGGIVKRATAVIAGEAGAEAIIPLSQADKYLGGGDGGGDTYNIHIHSKIADHTLPDLLVAELRKYNRRSGAIDIQVG